MRRFLASFFAIAIGAFPGVSGLSAAHADTIPLAGWNVTGGVTNIQYGDNVVVLTNPPVPSTQVSGAGGYARLEFSPTPTPSITATAVGYDPAAANGSAFAQGLFRYFGQVIAPGGAVVPTTINVVSHYSLFSQFGPGDGSDARVKLEVFGTTVVPLTASTEASNNGSFSRSMTVPVNTNQTFNVEMLVRAWTFETGTTATAFLDPFFFLDPIQIDQGFTLEFSPGMGNLNAAATPVPAALPLFVSGLAGLGFLVRRRRRRISAA